MSVVTSDLGLFNKYVSVFKERGESFGIEYFKGQRSLYIEGNLIKGYNAFESNKSKKKNKGIKYFDERVLSDSQIRSFFGVVRKSIDKYIFESNFYLEKLQRRDNVNSYFNYGMYAGLKEGSFFWAVDLDNSYWQGLYRLGVIKRSFYNRYYRLHNIYKRLKAISIGLSASERKRVYYIKGNVLLDSEGKSYEIKEDKWQWDVLYQNVRCWSYNTIFECVKFLGGSSKVLGYNIDCLTFSYEDSRQVSSYFQSLGLDYKLILCKKINDNYYSYGSELKKVKTNK